MYTQKIECKNGSVTLQKSDGNVTVGAIAKHDDGRTWNWHNKPCELSRDDVHELVDAVGGTDELY